MFLYRIKKLLQAGLIASLLVSLCFYFGYHLFDGERGLISFWKLQDSQVELNRELMRLQAVRVDMQTLVAKLNSASIDGDYLDELARTHLGYVAQNDLVILRPKPE